MKDYLTKQFEGIVDRLFVSGLVTTIVGLVLLTCGTYMYMFTEKEVGAGALLATGLVFLRAKSSLIGFK